MNSICYLFDGKAFKSAQRLDDENFIIYFTENKEYITKLLSCSAEKYTFGCKAAVQAVLCKRY